MPVKAAGGKEHECIVVDGYSHAIYTRPLRLRLEATEAFKIFKAAAEDECGEELCGIMTDNAQELCTGKLQEICEKEGIKLHTTSGILTSAARAMFYDVGLPRYESVGPTRYSMA